MSKAAKVDAKEHMVWGYAGVFPGEFRIWDGDPFTNKLTFMADHGFQSTGLGLNAVREPSRFDQLAAFVKEHDFHHNLHFGCRYFEDSPETLQASIRTFLKGLAEIREPLGVALVTTCVGPYHRYMRNPSLAEQMKRLREVLTPLARGCRELGVRVGIENHNDYLVTDLIELCDQVPNLGIFWDTGNSCMTGETPLVVSRQVVPYVVGTHFKDFTCYPDTKELKLVVTGASLGDGDVGLEQIYRDLIELNPAPEKLVMEFELVPDPKLNPLESLERSKCFVERISGFPFIYPKNTKI